jgi:hypothetical protein
LSKSRAPFYTFVALLLIAGFGLAAYRHIAFDVPWLPGEKRQIWSIEAKIEYLAKGEPVKLSLAIPDTQMGFERLGEHTASPGYGLAFTDAAADGSSGRRAEWSARSVWGKQTLYYRVDMLVDPNQRVDLSSPSIAPPKMLQGDGPQVTAALQLLENALARSADNFTLTRELIREFRTEAQSAQLLGQAQTRIDWLVDLLHHAGVPARKVLLLNLEDGRRRQSLAPVLQVFEGDGYQLFDPATGKQGRKPNQILWEYHSAALLDLIGGNQSTVHFSVIEQEVPVNQVIERESVRRSSLLDFSIHSLPLEEQALFKGILLIPVGVLVVVMLRILVGLRTSGTFMPVLIAMAFIQTSLLTGVVGFLLIVGVGLMIRSYLSQLNLLLIARISAVIISVIVLIAVFAVLAYQLGLSEGLKITFFPMIILSWTIERMSILWEEEGPKQVLVQGGGSLVVAMLAYVVMTNDIVRHLTFNFLSLQLIFMALVLMLGSYKGYRLSEIRRFKELLPKDGN